MRTRFWTKRLFILENSMRCLLSTVTLAMETLTGMDLIVILTDTAITIMIGMMTETEALNSEDGDTEDGGGKKINFTINIM